MWPSMYTWYKFKHWCIIYPHFYCQMAGLMVMFVTLPSLIPITIQHTSNSWGPFKLERPHTCWNCFCAWKCILMHAHNLASMCLMFNFCIIYIIYNIIYYTYRDIYLDVYMHVSDVPNRPVCLSADRLADGLELELIAGKHQSHEAWGGASLGRVLVTSPWCTACAALNYYMCQQIASGATEEQCDISVQVPILRHVCHNRAY